MNSKNRQFNNEDIGNIKSIVGKTIKKIVHDEFIYTNTTFGHISIFVNDKIYELKCKIENFDYFGDDEDVAVLSFNKVSKSDVKSELEDAKQTETNINETLLSVEIVNEHQYVKSNNKEYIYDFTRGIILHFRDIEYAFGMSAWFSEIIEIYKGHNLIEKFNNDNEFNESFSNAEDKKVERNITKL